MAFTDLTATLFSGMDMDAPQLIEAGGGVACVFTASRPGRETANEDALAVITMPGNAVVLAVADGLGGRPAGDLASGMALEHLAHSILSPTGDLQRDAILNGLDAANTALLDSGSGGGTTLAVAGIDAGMLRTSHVGDSMVLVSGQRGRLKYQTVPQSPVGYAEAAGILDEQEAMFHDHRHLVSSIVGSADMRVETGPQIRLALRDTVVIGSDGLFDNLYVGEIVELVRAGPLRTAAARLLAACRRRMAGLDEDMPHKPDDLAFILYRKRPGR